MALPEFRTRDCRCLHSFQQRHHPPICSLPPTSPLQIGRACAVDPTGAEERCSSAALQVAVDGSGRVCGITKRRQQALDPAMLMVRAFCLAGRLGAGRGWSRWVGCCWRGRAVVELACGRASHRSAGVDTLLGGEGWRAVPHPLPLRRLLAEQEMVDIAQRLGPKLHRALEAFLARPDAGQ